MLRLFRQRHVPPQFVGEARSAKVADKSPDQRTAGNVVREIVLRLPVTRSGLVVRTMDFEHYKLTARKLRSRHGPVFEDFYLTRPGTGM